MTRWTVRAAIACYFAVLFIHIRHDTERAERWARVLWTAGLIWFLIHVAAAFHWYHHDSHAEAYRHTAQRTAQITGLHWGGGLYVNEVFALIWIADTISWWRSTRQPRPWFRTVHVIFAFMVFNATVVFGPPVWKLVAVVVIPALGLAWARSSNRRHQAD